MRGISKQLDVWAYRGARFSAVLGLAGILTLAFAIVLDVLARWLFNAPITGVRDLSSLFVAMAIAASFPACIAESQHITIRFFGKLLGPWYEAAFEVFGYLVTAVIFAAMAWQLWLYADSLATEKEVTMILGWALSPWWRIVSAITALCVIIQIFVLVRSVKSYLFHSRSPN
jgi:TRAP-type C4-dicarboxylate transport system permease small subunit